MAEEEAAAEAGEQDDSDIVDDGPKGAWLKHFIILAVFVLMGQSIVAYVLVTQEIIPWYFGEEETAEEIKAAAVVKREAVPVDAPIIYDVPEMIVNPQDYHTLRYLNVKMAVEFEAQETLDFLTSDPVAPAKLLEVIRKTLNMTSFYELDETRERGPLREKLVIEINSSGVLEGGIVSKVYFQRFVAQ